MENSTNQQVPNLDTTAADNVSAEHPEIPLPMDYSTVFGDPRANDEIRNLIQQVQDLMTQQHQTELEQLHVDHKAQLDQLQAELSQLTDRTAKAEQGIEAEQAAHNETKKTLLAEQAQRKEAEQNRDNAVRLKEEAEAERDRFAKENASLKGQIDELEGMVRTLKPAKATSGLQLTSTLKPETDDERKARLERQRVETINRNLERRGIEPLKLPEIPTTNQPASAEDNQEVNQRQLDNAFPSLAGGQAVARNDAGGTGVSETQAAVAQAGDATAASALNPEIEARFKRIEDQLGLKSWRYDAEDSVA